MDTYLTMDQLEPRRIYTLDSRNLLVGVWNPAVQGFIGIREKFGDRYLFTEYHWDTGTPLGAAKPTEAIEVDGLVPDSVLLEEHAPGIWCTHGTREVRRDGDGTPALYRHIADETACDDQDRRLLGNQELFDILAAADARVWGSLIR